VPFSVPVAAVPPTSSLTVPASRIPATRRITSRRPTAPTIARAATLAGVRRSLLAVGYVLVAVLIVTRSPFFLSAFAAGSTTPIQPPGVDVTGPATSSPTAVPSDAGSPTPGELSPTPTPEPTPDPSPPVDPPPSP
jgi:hypothetical protein